MKKTIKTMLAFVAVALVLNSCSSEDILDNGENVSYGNMTFTASVSNDEGVDTRTALDDLNVVWSEGDAISVFSSAAFGTNCKMTLASEAGTTTGSFTGTCASGDSYYAIFPYSKDNDTYFGDSFNYLLLSWDGREQTAVNGSFDPSVPMLAKTTGVSDEATTVPLNFKNLLSFVKVTTDYKCKSITLTSKKSSVYISGNEESAEFNEDGNPYIKGLGPDRRNYVTLKGKDDAIIEAGTYYIAVFPGTLSEGFDLTFTAVNGTDTYTKSTTKEVTFKRNNILNLGTINLRGTDIETLEGDGSTENPYKINDLEDLITFQRWISSEKGDTWKKSYLQTADIDAEGKKMAPIGTADHRFWGTYDGGNHYIKNLCIEGSIEYRILNNLSATDRASALFGAIKDATICNLTVWNPSFSMDTDSNFNTVSPFVGVAYSADDSFDNSRCKILNCHLKGQECRLDFPSDNDNWREMSYGGFVADSQCNLEITDCETDLNLTINYNRTAHEAWIGGFVGRACGVNVDNSGSLERDGYVRINRCRNNAQYMKFEEQNFAELILMGGIIGYAYDWGVYDDDVACRVYNCVNNASITVLRTNYREDETVWLGGIIGNNDSDGYSDVDPTIENCANNGNLTITTPDTRDIIRRLGGISGSNYDSDTKLTNCVNTGTLTVEPSYQRPGAISFSYGTFRECWNCSGDYDICVKSAGDMTNCGQKSMDEIVDHMNSTPSVTSDPNNYFHRWRKIIFDGREVLDLEF